MHHQVSKSPELIAAIQDTALALLDADTHDVYVSVDGHGETGWHVTHVPQKWASPARKPIERTMEHQYITCWGLISVWVHWTADVTAFDIALLMEDLDFWLELCYWADFLAV